MSWATWLASASSNEAGADRHAASASEASVSETACTGSTSGMFDADPHDVLSRLPWASKRAISMALASLSILKLPIMTMQPSVCAANSFTEPVFVPASTTTTPRRAAAGFHRQTDWHFLDQKSPRIIASTTNSSQTRKPLLSVAPRVRISHLTGMIAK